MPLDFASPPLVVVGTLSLRTGVFTRHSPPQPLEPIRKPVAAVAQASADAAEIRERLTQLAERKSIR
jgi:hypothetical protein